MSSGVLVWSSGGMVASQWWWWCSGWTSDALGTWGAWWFGLAGLIGCWLSWPGWMMDGSRRRLRERGVGGQRGEEGGSSSLGGGPRQGKRGDG